MFCQLWVQTQNFGCSTGRSALPLIPDIVTKPVSAEAACTQRITQAKLSFDFVFVVADATRRARTWRPQSHCDNTNEMSAGVRPIMHARAREYGAITGTGTRFDSIPTYRPPGLPPLAARSPPT